MVTVTIAMLMKNPTMKTLSKVTTCMMTKMTTVLHWDQEDWSSSLFSTVQVAFVQGVLWSSRCCCLLLAWVERPCVVKGACLL